MLRLSWLNAKRLRDYPRLIFIASWAVLLLNFLFHDGWIGGLTGKLVGSDFICNYAGGILYHQDIAQLYDPSAQLQVQSELIAPSQSPIASAFISPPYVALAYSWLQPIPLSVAFIAWQVLNLLSVLLSVMLAFRYILPPALTPSQLTRWQLLVILLSSFIFVNGFVVGQSHGLTLLLYTAILAAMLKERWVLAGLLGSLLTYKPQLVFGFLILWLVWGCLKSLLSFGLLTLLWQLPILLSHGLSPYFNFLEQTRLQMYLPYAKQAFSVYIMSTPYELLATLLPVSLARPLQAFFVLVGLAMTLVLAWLAWRERRRPLAQRHYSLALALLFPLIVAPHVHLYDLIILTPFFLLLANRVALRPGLKTLAIFIYVGGLLLVVVGFLLKLALPGLIPLTALAFLARAYLRSPELDPPLLQS